MNELALKHMLARIWKQKNENDPTPAPTEAGKVLVADDSRTIVHALTLMLGRAGFRTLAAFDGREAVDIARRESPDLILMDIVMPVMNGFEAMRRLKADAATQAIPIIVITGEQQSDRTWGARLGAAGFLTKPVAKEELLLMARFLIGRKAGLAPVVMRDPAANDADRRAGDATADGQDRTQTPFPSPGRDKPW